MSTVGGMFVAAARDYPDRVFLRWCRGDDRITWTYGEAARRVDALVAELDGLRIEAGQHVVIHTAEMVPSILFDLACACAGVVFTPLETSSLPAVNEMVARIRARAVLTTPDRSGPYEGVARLAYDPHVEVVGHPGPAIARLGERVARLDGDHIYMLQPTSGTTGGSKLVIRHHAVFARIGPILGPGLARVTEPPSRFLMVAALTHGMGQYLLSIAMSLAAELSVTSKIDVGASLGEVRELDPTYIGLTPRVLRSFVQQLGGVRDGDRIFGPSAKRLMSGGAAPDNDLLAIVEHSGVHVIEAYGASEMSVVATTRPGTWQPGVVGPVVDDVTLRTSDEGELQALTPVMMRGYYGSPDDTLAAFTEDGYYRTGDRVAIDPDGQLRYLGRVVDSFNLFDGSHVAPGPIEDAITRLPWVGQAMLLGDQRPYLTGLLVTHPALRGRASRAALRKLIETDLGRICSTLETNARVRRIAILSEPLPAEVYQIVGHGKVRRLRAAAAKHLAKTVEALYSGAPADEAIMIDVPGAAAERRANARHPLAWLIHGQVGERSLLGYARDISRSGAFIATVELPPVGTPMTLEVIEAEGHGLRIEAEVLRAEPPGVAVRWLGPATAIAELARRLKP